MTTTTARVLPLFVVPFWGDGSIVENGAECIGEASDRDGAIAAAREAGFEVVTEGGAIEVAPGEPFRHDGDVWTVTVWKKGLPVYRVAHRDLFDADWQNANAYHIGEGANEFRSFRDACSASDSLDSTCDWTTCVVEIDGRNKPRVVYG